MPQQGRGLPEAPGPSSLGTGTLGHRRAPGRQRLRRVVLYLSQCLKVLTRKQTNLEQMMSVVFVSCSLEGLKDFLNLWAKDKFDLPVNVAALGAVGKSSMDLQCQLPSGLCRPFSRHSGDQLSRNSMLVYMQRTQDFR